MSLRESSDRLKHDLGKYVCFQVRWLAEGAPEAELRAALLDDLRRTRRGPTGDSSAAALWAELRAPLISAPGFAALDADIAALVARADTLDGATLPELRATAEAARAVADHIRRFCKAVG